MVCFLIYQAKTSLGVDPSRGMELALSPQHELAIARLPRETHALGHQPSTDPEAARLGLYQVSVFLTTNTEPTISPSLSAIQHRSRLGSKCRMNFAAMSATSASNCSS